MVLNDKTRTFSPYPVPYPVSTSPQPKSNTKNIRFSPNSTTLVYNTEAPPDETKPPPTTKPRGLFNPHMGNSSEHDTAPPIANLPKKIYRPKLTSEYKDPNFVPDTTEDLDVIFKDYGSSVARTKSPLPP